MESMIKGIEEYPDLRLTLDTIEDFKIQQKLYSELESEGLSNSPKTIIEYIDTRYPEIYEKMRENIKVNTK